MPATAAPFGLRPSLSRVGQVTDRTIVDAIPSGYASTIAFGDPVAIVNGQVQLSAAGSGQTVDGIFRGCSYIDASGRACTRPAWTGGTAVRGTVKALIAAGIDAEYEVQADGPLTRAAIGRETVLTNLGTTLNSLSGVSGASLATGSFVAPGGQGSVRVVGFVPELQNAPTDAFPLVRVVLAKTLYADGVSA